MAIHAVDVAIVVLYLVAITAIGLWYSRHDRGSSSGYFLAGRSLGWVTIGLALFATNISTVHLTGLAGAGFNEGLVFGNFEWLAPFLLLLLGLVFAPFYFRTRVATLPEYLEGRYGPGSRTVLAILGVIGAFFIHIGVTIYAGAEVMKRVLPFETPSWWQPLAPYLDFNIALSITIVSAMTILYTALGGLKAVVVTEAIQTILLLLGAAAVTGFGLARLAERDVMSLRSLHRACLIQEARDARDNATLMRRTAGGLRRLNDAPGPAAEAVLVETAAALKGSPATPAVLAALAPDGEESPARDALAACLDGKPPGIRGWRALDIAKCAAGLDRAADREEERAQTWDAGSRSESPYSTRLSMVRTQGSYTWWIMLLGYPVLGVWYWCADQTIVQRVLGARTEWDAQVGPIFAGFIKVLPVFLMVLPGIIAYVLFRDRIGANPDSTLSVLILELLPMGLQGLVLAGLLAALMSTVAGALNSAATLVSIDIVQRLWPSTPDRVLVRVGQVTAVVGMALAVAWSTQGQHFGGIFAGINQMISVLAPPVSAVFLWGVFWRRATAAGALATLIGGGVLGLVVFVLDFPAFGMQVLTRRLGLPFLLQAWLLFVACGVILVSVSLLTPPPEPEKVAKYCWPNPLAFLTGQKWAGLTDPRLVALALTGVMALLYAIFA